MDDALGLKGSDASTVKTDSSGCFGMILVGEEAADLGGPEGFVEAAAVQELGVGAVFDDCPLVEDKDAVHVEEGGESVGDDDGGFSLHQVRETLLDALFCDGIEL